MSLINSVFESVTQEDWSEEVLNAEYGEPKSRAIMVSLMVRTIIEENSSPFHHITQEEIRKKLDRWPYSMDVERKCIARNVNTLTEEYPFIRKDENGSLWYDRRREDDFLIGRAA